MENGRPRQNLEVKATIRDKSLMREKVMALATDSLGVQLQTDTYFECQNGRLKLREIELEDGSFHAQLIHYHRPDVTQTTSSHYRIAPISDGPALKPTLASALGVWETVRKRREIFLYENVRIHIDEVEGLGDFVEFEAVQEPGMDESSQKQLVDWLCRQLAVADSDRLAESYSNLVSGK